jgi:hypothetical protein
MTMALSATKAVGSICGNVPSKSRIMLRFLLLKGCLMADAGKYERGPLLRVTVLLSLS